MNKLFIIAVLGIVLITGLGITSAYFCISPEDNQEVQKFKHNLNILSVKHDIEKNNLTQEAFKLKVKYFGGCN